MDVVKDVLGLVGIGNPDNPDGEREVRRGHKTWVVDVKTTVEVEAMDVSDAAEQASYLIAGFKPNNFEYEPRLKE